MPPLQLIMDDKYMGDFEHETSDGLMIIVKDRTEQNKDREKKVKKRRRKFLKEMWENEDFMQIKGIQKTQEVVNRSLRNISLEKMRLSRIKRIGEVSDYERRRREAKQQKLAMKDVLQKTKINNEYLQDELDFKGTNKRELNKENVLMNNKNTLDTRSKEINKTKSSNKSVEENRNDILPPLVRTTKRKPFIVMDSLKNCGIDTTSLKSKTESNNNNDIFSGGNKRSIVITIPDVNTDAGLYSQKSAIQLSTHESETSSRRSYSAKSDRGTQCVITNEPCDHENEKVPDYSLGDSKLPELPPIKFTLHGTNGPPVSYYVNKDSMISFRPNFGSPRVGISDDKTQNPSMLVSPQNSSISIPLVRKDNSSSKENLSIIGKNLQQSTSSVPNVFKPSMRLVSSYDLTSNASETSSRPGSRTTPRTSMKGHKLIKKKTKESKTVKKESQCASNTGFAIREFSVQDRSKKWQSVDAEKQFVHEFPVHVRERYIKKKLLFSKNDKQDQVSWKVRKYVTSESSYSYHS